MDGIKNELLNYKKIQDCETFEQLEAVLDEIGIVPGSRKEYTANRLKEKIRQLRLLVNTLPYDLVHWNLVTRTYGIRAKCMELFWYEKREG